MNHIYIIAEIGNTHEGSLGLAKQFIKAAAECGVNAVKLQTHMFDCESLLSAPNPPYFKDESRKEYFDRTAFSLDQWKELKRFTEEEMKVDFFSSPFSLEAIDLLSEVGVDTLKIPSGEVNNIPLLEKAAKSGKRVILSSGMSSWEELDEAVTTLQENGCADLVVLQCTSEYPCPPEESGLNVLAELRARYKNIQVGYSDHTMGIAVPLAAVVLGATVVEKHFTLSQKMYGSDAKNSTEPEEFKRLVTEIRNTEKALSNNVDKDEKVKALGQMKLTFEKSVVTATDLTEGRVIEFDDLAFKKPGDGIPAREYKKVIGKTLTKNISKDQKLTWENLR